jgi:ADP-ribose pyrophosphatase YjhB (NUDIX family)
MNKLTSSELNDIVEILKKLEPGEIPFDLFHQFARLYVTPIVEIVPLKKYAEEKITTVLLQRDKNDPIWPKMMHTPGTVVRALDKEGDLSDAFNRILKEELSNLKIIYGPKLVSYEFHQVKRGRELALVFFVEYTGCPINGKEVDVNKLPRNIVDTQLNFIKKAVSCFKKYKKL